MPPCKSGNKKLLNMSHEPAGIDQGHRLITQINFIANMDK